MFDELKVSIVSAVAVIRYHWNSAAIEMLASLVFLINSRRNRTINIQARFVRQHKELTQSNNARFHFEWFERTYFRMACTAHTSNFPPNFQFSSKVAEKWFHLQIESKWDEISWKKCLQNKDSEYCKIFRVDHQKI